MKTFLRFGYIVIAALCWTSTIAAVTPAPTGAQTLQTLLLKFQSLQANFVETMVVQGQKQVASGTVAIQRPNRFRWETLQPNQQLFISDSKQLWQYEADLNQVTVRGINSHDATYSPLMLLSGEVANLSTLYTIKVLGNQQFELIPKDSNSLIASMTLTFTNGVLSQLVLKNTLHQTTLIQFTKVVMNQPLSAKLFQFVPPSSADVLKG